MPVPIAGVNPRNGKRNPVTLVAIVVARKTSVHRSSGFDRTIPKTATNPDRIPIRLIRTWKAVKSSRPVMRHPRCHASYAECMTPGFLTSTRLLRRNRVITDNFPVFVGEPRRRGEVERLLGTSLHSFHADEVLLRLLVARVCSQRALVGAGRRDEASLVLERHAQVVVERRDLLVHLDGLGQIRQRVFDESMLQ